MHSRESRNFFLVVNYDLTILVKNKYTQKAFREWKGFLYMIEILVNLLDS